jgi:hypothetical protein
MIAATHAETAANALLERLVEDLDCALDLVGDHLQRNLSEPSVALADAHGRLKSIVEAVEALDALDPAGWNRTIRP